MAGNIRTQKKCPKCGKKFPKELKSLQFINNFVFVNRRGRPLSSTRVWAAWNQAAKQAGIDIPPCNSTRHSFATQKLMDGHSERLVMEATGHKTVQSFRRYGKVMTETLRSMIEGEPEPRVRTASKPRVGQNEE